MNGGRPDRGEPDLPAECPECGRLTCFRPPEGPISSFLTALLSSVILVALFGLSAFGIDQVEVGLVVAAAGYVGAVGSVFFLLRATDGIRIAKLGFVLCPECDWMRIGEKEGIRLGRLRARGARWFRAIFWALVPPLAFFTILAVQAGSHEAWTFAVAILWPTFVAFTCGRTYRPRGHARS